MFLRRLRFAITWITICACIGALLRLAGAREGLVLPFIMALFIALFVVKIVLPESREQRK